MAIVDGFVGGRDGMSADGVRRRALALVEAGAPFLSLRDHGADRALFQTEAARLTERLRAARPDLVLSVHGRLETARTLGAGIHTGAHGPTLTQALSAGLTGPVGVSCHDAEDVRRSAAADYVTLSPLFTTRTHPEAHPLGLDALTEAVGVGVPVLALGGMTPARASEAVRRGAHGVAVLSGLLDAPDPARAVAAFLDALGAEPGPPSAV